MTKLRTHYDNLKVARDAPDFVIRAAYKTLSQKYHPDKNPGDERATRVMAIINQSYEVLADSARRKEHDEWIRAQELLQAADALNRARSEAAQPKTPPFPPQWQQPEQTAAHPAKKNIAFRLLFWPLKLVGKILFAVPQLGLLALLFGGIWLWDALTPDRPPPPGSKPYQAEAPVQPTPAPDRPAYVRPEAAPNGSPWPAQAGYVKGYPIDNGDGYSEVTVDNAQNDSDVFVKLVSLDGATAYPVRQFYIPAGSRFTMNQVTAGQYDLRYRDLNTGGLSRSESFDVEETRTDDGVEYSSLTMTLYKVQGGNFQTYGLGEAEF